jgi:hypothetical protein
MPKILVGDSGKVKVGTSGKLADKNCCCTRPPCGWPDLAIAIWSVNVSKCGFFSECTSKSTADYPEGPCGTSGAIDDILVPEDCGDAKCYLTRTTTITGCANPNTGPCPDTGDASGTVTIIDTTDHPGCSVSNDVDGEIVCSPPEPCGSLACVSKDIVWSDEFTDALLWGDIDTALNDSAYPSPMADFDGTFGNPRGEFGVEIGQQYSDNPILVDEGGAIISVSRAKWRMRVPEGFMDPGYDCGDCDGSYMKVWVWKETLTYDDDGNWVSYDNSFYAAYEWDAEINDDEWFNDVETLAIDTTPGTNQTVTLYIRNFTCVRVDGEPIDCNTAYPYPDGCMEAGGF